MELPKINSLRSKTITLNNKKIVIKPWTNLQLTNFDSLYNEENNSKFKNELIYDELIKNNIEYSGVLTLLEEKMILIELYKMSKSNIIDVSFTCKECKAKSGYVIDITKAVQWVELKTRTIKTKDCIFNLRLNSQYRINLKNDINIETINYIASYIDSFEYQDTNYEGFDLETLSNWLINELDKINFEELIRKFNEVQPRIDFKVQGVCEFCGTKQDLNFKGVEDFLD